ncbi:MAG TPA: hypothetical protein PLO45_09115 [Defluviitoga sp.]|jgi:hypothetical protein|nr:hypothetical protein [Defluviitoga sp.]HPZ74708.1 hypothetical protein [Candidatus Pacearchaeota archaeon]
MELMTPKEFSQRKKINYLDLLSMIKVKDIKPVYSRKNIALYKVKELEELLKELK